MKQLFAVFFALLAFTPVFIGCGPPDSVTKIELEDDELEELPADAEKVMDAVATGTAPSTASASCDACASADAGSGDPEANKTTPTEKVTKATDEINKYKHYFHMLKCSTQAELIRDADLIKVLDRFETKGLNAYNLSQLIEGVKKRVDHHSTLVDLFANADKIKKNLNKGIEALALIHGDAKMKYYKLKCDISCSENKVTCYLKKPPSKDWEEIVVAEPTQ